MFRRDSADALPGRSRSRGGVDQNKVIEFLCASDSHGIAGPVKRIDTQGAVVFLAGDRAYKLKRAAPSPFADFSTVARRREACEKEIAANRANAPDIYLDVLPVTRDGGRLRLGGEGEAVDWVVRMRRFDETMTLDRLAAAGKLDAPLLAAVAQAVLGSHRQAPLRDGASATADLERRIRRNDEAFRRSPHLFAAAEVEGLTRETKEALDAVRPSLIARGEAGLVRRCHGGMHLRNIVLIAGRPVLFGAVEFDDAGATCDVLCDLALLLADLWSRGYRQEANAVFNGYLWAANDEVQFASLRALPLFLALHAAHQARIAAAAAVQRGDADTAMEEEAKRHFGLAQAFLAPRPRRLVAVGGLPGAGKSTLAAALAPFLGPAPGAVILRGDIERKQLAGIPEHEYLPPSAHTPAATAAIYERLNREASLALDAGYAVLLDAVHGQGPERDVAEGIAMRAGVPFTGLWLDAPPSVMIRRVTERSNGTSEADAAVFLARMGRHPGRISWHRLDAGFPQVALVDEALSMMAVKRGNDPPATPSAVRGCGRACLEAADGRARWTQ